MMKVVAERIKLVDENIVPFILRSDMPSEEKVDVLKAINEHLAEARQNVKDAIDKKRLAHIEDSMVALGRLKQSIEMLGTANFCMHLIACVTNRLIACITNEKFHFMDVFEIKQHQANMSSGLAEQSRIRGVERLCCTNCL
jgi:hypothetical protein